MSVLTSEGFDGVTPPALPAGWTATSNPLSTSASVSRSSPNALHNGSPFARDTYFDALDGNGGDCRIAASFRVASGYSSPGSGLRLILRDADQDLADCYFCSVHTRTDQASVAVYRRLGGGSLALDAITLSGSSPIDADTWYRVTFTAEGTSITLRVQRESDSQYLAHDGTWGASEVDCCSATNSDVTGEGYAGIALENANYADAYADDVVIDDLAGGGGDTTPPTASGWATNPAGTSIAATLTEACTPGGGTGGFTLSGTSATVSGWAIGGTTLTLTLSGSIAHGETVAVSYDDATASEAIADASSNLLADIASAAVANNVPQPLTPGAASFISSGPGGISVSSTAAAGGDTSGDGYAYQWERSEDGGSYADVSGATALTLDDATATTAGVLYRYRLRVTDDAAATATGNAVTAEAYQGGAIGGGGFRRIARIYGG